jgi:hypothetical protein
VTAAFAPRVAILDLLASGCNPITVAALTDGDNCTETCAEACLPAGRYALFVSTIGFDDGVPCGSPYVGRVECTPCDPPPPCLPEPPLAQIDPRQVPLPYYECLYLCPEFPTLVCIGPGLTHAQVPVINIFPGCSPLNTACDEECPPATFVNNGGWFYDPATGSWYIRLIGSGCVCFCLDGILPVELSSFDAIAGDASVTLNWATASESDNDHFDILRDGSVVGRVTANNSTSGSSYTWTETGLANGREYSYSLVAVDISGIRDEIGVASATPSMSNANVTEYALLQNYPNPFNPETNIVFDVAEAGYVKLTVFNSLGQTVATLVNGSVEAGRHSVDFTANNLTSGLYFYRLEAGDFTAIRKMVLMK